MHAIPLFFIAEFTPTVGLGLTFLGLAYALVPFALVRRVTQIDRTLQNMAFEMSKGDLKEDSDHTASLAILKELKIQNDLTRQLLKAYGHEPEV